MQHTQRLLFHIATNILVQLRKSIIYLSLLSGLSLPIVAHALSLDNVPVITLDQGQISVYRDKSNQLTFDDIRSKQAQHEFKPLTGNLSAGYVPDTFWLHFSLNRTETQPSNRWLEIIPPYLDSIELYHINPKGQIDHRSAGDFLPQSAKEEAYRGHLFKLDFEPGQHEIYLRLKTSSTMTVLIKLWQPEAFFSHIRNSYFVFGLYFSLILTVLLFNLVNWVISRRTIFIIYVSYLMLDGIQWLGINGFVAEFIFPEQPLLANLSLGISLSLSASLTFIFFSMLFEMRQYHPRLYILNLFGAFLALITAISTPLGYYQVFAPWLLVTGIIAICLAPWPLIRLWKTNKIWNRLLVISYSAYAILVSLNILSSLALLPFNEPIIYAGMVSNIFHILVLHFALMLHYHRIESRHKETLQQKAVLEKEMELEQSHNEEQSQLLAMISHEIRTPIAVIHAANESLQIIDDKTILNEDRTLRYGRIHNAVMRMNMVMEMALAQNEQNNCLFEKTVVDLKNLTLEIIELSGEEAVQRVVFDIPEMTATVAADRPQLRIALLNLLGNALKYSPKNSPINISIQNTNSEKGVGVSWIIDDQGPGVPDEMREKIFEKYQRGDERSNQAGMGLGLFLVDRIVERHDGEIIVGNSPNGGARFCLCLPNSSH